jgi:hypothetical protein
MKNLYPLIPSDEIEFLDAYEEMKRSKSEHINKNLFFYTLTKTLKNKDTEFTLDDVSNIKTHLECGFVIKTDSEGNIIATAEVANEEEYTTLRDEYYKHAGKINKIMDDIFYMRDPIGRELYQLRDAIFAQAKSTQAIKLKEHGFT